MRAAFVAPGVKRRFGCGGLLGRPRGGVGILSEEAIRRLVGAILLEQNDEWAVQRVRRRISRTCCSAVCNGPNFWLMIVPSQVTMSPKHSSTQSPQSVLRFLTADTHLTCSANRVSISR